MPSYVFRCKGKKITYFKEHAFFPGPNSYRNDFPKGDIWCWAKDINAWQRVEDRAGTQVGYCWAVVHEEHVPAILKLHVALIQ